MDAFEQRFSANPEQAQYWNSDAGRKWVDNDAAMSERLRPMAAQLIQRSGVAAGEHVLDIGCGAGATTEQLGRAVGASGRVLGLDISEPLLALARTRCSGLEHVRFENADAQVHPFSGPGFNLLVSRFGVMFFSDPPAAFTNLRQALRPHGRLHFVCWAAAEANPWFTVPLAVAVRHLGAVEPPPPRAPGPLAFAETDYVTGILTAAGFRDIHIETVSTSMTGSEPLQQQVELCLRMGPAARLVAEQSPGPAVMDALTADLAAELGKHAIKGRISLGAAVHYVSAGR